MNLVLADIKNVFKTEDVNYVNTLVIENRDLFWKVTDDLYRQSIGLSGASVLSHNDKIIEIERNMEIIDRFIGFELNKKTLISKIATALETVAIDEAHFLSTQKLLSDIESAVYDWAFEFPCNITPSKISVGSLIKAVGIELADDYSGPAGAVEKLIDYMELVREFDRNKLFFFVNMRSYYDDVKTELFMKTALAHQFCVFLLDNKEYTRLPLEKRHIVDDDLCEI